MNLCHSCGGASSTLSSKIPCLGPGPCSTASMWVNFWPAHLDSRSRRHASTSGSSGMPRQTYLFLVGLKTHQSVVVCPSPQEILTHEHEHRVADLLGHYVPVLRCVDCGRGKLGSLWVPFCLVFGKPQAPRVWIAPRTTSMHFVKKRRPADFAHIWHFPLTV